MATKLWAIGMIVLCTLFTSVAQVLYKYGSARLELSVAGILYNYFIIIGLLLYAIGAVLMIIAFKGGEVSVLYPIIATSYIWVALLAAYFFDDKVNIYRWMGIVLIIVGIIFISSFNQEKKEEVIEFTEAV